MQGKINRRSWKKKKETLTELLVEADRVLESQKQTPENSEGDSAEGMECHLDCRSSKRAP